MEAGGGTIVHEVLINNLEFECAAINGKYCLHANLSQDNIDKSDKKLISSQLDRKYLRKRQEQVLKETGNDPSKYGF